MTGALTHSRFSKSAASIPVSALFSVLFACCCFGQEKGTTDESLVHLDLERKYLLHLPEGKKPESPLALIIALHGATMNGKLLEGQTELSQLSDQEKDFAVVYPSADPGGGGGFWDFFSPDVSPDQSPRIASGRDDAGYIAALIDKLIAEGIADPKRVFVTGISNGAFMTNRLSISIPDKIAAVAPVAGTLPLAMIQKDMKTAALPIIYFHGTEDKLVGVDGSDFITRSKMSLSADAFIDWWAKRNGLDAKANQQVELPDKAANDGCTVVKHYWESNTYPVVFYEVKGGGHTWPGGTPKQPKQLLGNICFDIDASELMWDFFKSHAP